jgi:hypothetical protein
MHSGSDVTSEHSERPLKNGLPTSQIPVIFQITQKSDLLTIFTSMQKAKKTSLNFLVILILSVSASTARAQLIVYESFSEMALGSGISGSGSDSFGWSSPWTGLGTSDSRFQIIDPTPDVAFQIAGGKLISGGNRALLITTAPEPAGSNLFMVRKFARTPRISTSLYFGFLLRIPASGTGTDTVDFHLLSGDTTVMRYAIRPYNNTPPSAYMFGFQGATGETGGGKTIPGDNSQPHLIVIESLRTSSQSESYSFDHYVDPGTTYPGMPGGFTISTQQIDGIGINVKSWDTGGPSTTVIIDEIKVGYTWRDIVNPVENQEIVPDLSIENAIKLRWYSRSGKTYQVQYSFDLTKWFNLGSPIAGDNRFREVFDSTASDAKKLYRVQVK